MQAFSNKKLIQSKATHASPTTWDVKIERNEKLQNIFHWLVKPNNLTETIKQTGMEFSLQLLEQSIGTPYADEISAFDKYNIDASSALIRKVFLEGDKTPLVFARVIAPEQTYLNYYDVFNNLGTAVIGNTFLYANKEIKRQEFEFGLIQNGSPFFAELKILKQICDDNNTYWARRSIFVLPKGHLLITEIFLNMPDYPV